MHRMVEWVEPGTPKGVLRCSVGENFKVTVEPRGVIPMGDYRLPKLRVEAGDTELPVVVWTDVPSDSRVDYELVTP